MEAKYGKEEADIHFDEEKADGSKKDESKKNESKEDESMKDGKAKLVFRKIP